MDAPNGLINYREQILELHQRLIEYVQRTNQNFSILNDRLNKIQDKVDKLPTKMETKIAEISKEINKLDTIINVNARARSMKFFQKYLCELCSNAIARQPREGEFDFVSCAMNMNGFPLDRKCSEFKFEDSIME